MTGTDEAVDRPKLANAGTHGEVVTVDVPAVNDLGRMVDGILAS